MRARLWNRPQANHSAVRAVTVLLALFVAGLAILAPRIGRGADDKAWSVKFEDRFKEVLKPNTDYRAIVTLEKGGELEIQFFPDVAPNHVANFVSLAKKGYYNGLTFHRVIPGFMAQGGDPTGKGSGGPGYAVKAEFNDKPHVRGTVSMARTNDPNSAGSQFFICFQPTPQLDHKYTVFGQVVKGMEVVDKITPRDPDRATTPGDKIKEVKIVETPAKPAAK